MSHRASHWLATIPAGLIGAGAFRVLFHFCDAHNSHWDPESACFPGQETRDRNEALDCRVAYVYGPTVAALARIELELRAAP